MHTALWIVASVLAVAFFAVGAMKLIQPRAKLADAGMTYVEDFSDHTVKLIGALEILAAIGLIVPALLDLATILVPLAATGLAVVMIGAITVHARRSETQSIALNLVLGGLVVFVAWGRFGPHSF